MSNLLAVSNSGSIEIEKFNMTSYFFTDTYLYKKLKINEPSATVFEIFFASFLLLVLSPIFLLTALSIKLFMGGGDVFYTQERVGKGGVNFRIFKFRSMIENAEAVTGPTLATKDDPRITKLGKFLRASHIDELPQLINVLKGEMSFVGPRPEREVFVKEYEVTIESYIERRKVKPGITGLAQICLPYDATPAEKLEYDLYYINNQESVVLNVIISYYTALKMVTFFKAQ